MAGPAPTTLSDYRDRSAGPVHCSVWLSRSFARPAFFSYITRLLVAASRNHAALSLGVRFCVLKSTYTSP